MSNLADQLMKQLNDHREVRFKPSWSANGPFLGVSVEMRRQVGAEVQTVQWFVDGFVFRLSNLTADMVLTDILQLMDERLSEGE